MSTLEEDWRIFLGFGLRATQSPWAPNVLIAFLHELYLPEILIRQELDSDFS